MVVTRVSVRVRIEYSRVLNKSYLRARDYGGIFLSSRGSRGKPVVRGGLGCAARFRDAFCFADLFVGCRTWRRAEDVDCKCTQMFRFFREKNQEKKMKKKQSWSKSAVLS